MKKLVVSSVVMLLALCLCGCAAARSSYTGDVPQFCEPASGAQTAVFDTSYGTFTAVLYPEYAPKTVANFIALAEKGYYNGLSFHRVVSDLCIQSGDPTGTGTGGETADGAALQNEFTDELRNYRGALGMAASDDGVIGSQFYIVTSGPVDSDTEQKLADAGVEQGVIDVYKREGGAPHLDFRYTVFGQVYSGMDVVEKIGAIKTDSQNRPKKDVIINSVTISAYVPADQN